MLKELKTKIKYYIAKTLAAELKKIEYENLEKSKLNTLNKLKFCGSEVRINGVIKIEFPENVEIQSRVYIGNNAYINGRGGVVVGENTRISRNLIIYSANHNYHGKTLPYDNEHKRREVKIAQNVWIGANVVLVPGVKIGEGAIIGAGSVISKDVPPCAVVVSSPQRVVKYRDQEHYQKLLVQAGKSSEAVAEV